MKYLRSLFFCVIVASTGLVCGNPPTGLMAPNLMDGAEALAAVESATVTGLFLCLARTNRLNEFANRYQFSTVIASFQGIDAGRAYRENDVKMCAQTVELAVAFDPACTYAAWNCRLNPVDKLTGAN